MFFVSVGLSAVGDFVGAPLNLLKDMLGWVLGKFGFTETAKEIKEFDIVSKIANLTSGILLFPSRAIDWINNRAKSGDRAVSILIL